VRLGHGLAALAVTVGSVALAGPALAATTRSSSGSKSGAALNVSSIAGTIDPSVVDINTTLPQGAAAGTGMVLSSSGEVLTNNHVINGATSISVTVSGGRVYPAKVVGYDATDDVAVLQLQGAPKLPAISTSVSQPLVGDPVVAIGNALGRGGTPATAQGSVTALNQTITATDDGGSNPETLNGVIQVDANIQPGDSGGPLVNADGQVVGMDSAGSQGQQMAVRTDPGSGSGFSTDPGSGSGSGFGTDPGSGSGSGFGTDPGSGGGLGSGSNSGSGSTVGFAIPIQSALTIAHQIESGTTNGKVNAGSRAILGVEVQASNGQGGSTAQGGLGDQSGSGGQSTSGLQISGVESGTPAASAGLTAGDVIVSINGSPVQSTSDVAAALAKHKPGDKVQVSWVDTSGQQHQATVSLVAGPPT
jgi:S1-C subfamily serine protease